MSKLFIGIDVGGTNIKFGCFDSGINLISKTSVPTNAEMGPQAVIDSMARTILELLENKNLSPENIGGIGLATPGPANYKEGIIINATNMPKFKNVPVRQMLSNKLAKPVVFENDANTACWGEFVCGAGKDVNDMVFFTLGTGIGGGIITNGKLVQGCGGNGAELGHIIIYPGGRKCNCGQRGCVEAYASANWTARRTTEAVEQGFESSLKKVLDENGIITCKDVYDHLKAGDKLAKKITDETAEALAILCVNMLHTTEPGRMVFAGGMIAAGDILSNRIRYYFDKHIWPLKKETVEICFATLGEDAGIIGAAALAGEIGSK